MPTAPFAALESRLNSAVQRRLANATAVFQGGVPFGVLFDRAPADPFGGGTVDGASHMCGFGVAQTPGISEGSELQINDVAYVVASGVQPDASGWVSLGLYRKD